MKRHGSRCATTVALIACLASAVHAARVDAGGQTPEAAAPAQGAYSPRQMVAKFAALKRAQIGGLAAAEGIPVPAALEELLRTVELDDWPAASNLCAAVAADPGSGLHTSLWQPALEAYGFQEQVHLWHPELLALYARTLTDAIPAGSVYLGGTDPGRFVVTAYREVHGHPDFVVITQNALADNFYLAYLRQACGAQVQIPTLAENNAAFQEFVMDVQAGRTSPGADVSFKDGRVSVQGVQGVMAINGIISRKLFEANKDAHRFLVEESYVIPWMMPHLVPEGPLMRLESAPLASLPDEVVARDRAYWGELSARLLAHPRFAADEAARKTFSKLRSAIAGLYASRRLFVEAEHAFQQAIVLYPASPEASFRLADAYMQQYRFKEAAGVVESLFRIDPNPKTQGFLQQILDLAARNERRLALESVLSKGGTLEVALELLRIYGDMRLTASLDGLASKLLLQCKAFTPSQRTQVADTCRAIGRIDLAAQFDGCAQAP